MKNILSFCLCIVLLLGLSVPAFAVDSAAVDYCRVKIVVDGATIVPKDANGLPVEPFIYNGTTYLPVRSVANALGLDVTWESGAVKLTSGAERTAAIGKPIESKRNCTIPMGGQDTKVTLDGVELSLKDAAGNLITPIISNGVTYLPVRAIADALNVPVLWDGENATVYLGKAIEWKVSKCVYTSENYGTSTATCLYDERGNLLSETTVSPFYTDERIYTYNENNQVLTYIRRDNQKYDPTDETTTYTYDAAGNLLAKTVKGLDYISQETYTYDAQGNVLTHVKERSEPNDAVTSTVRETHVYTYDASGNRLTERYEIHGRSGVGISNYTETRAYDSRGNCLTVHQVYDDGNLYTERRTYDDRGNLVKCLYEEDWNGSQSSTIDTYTYDEKGNLLSFVFESMDEDGTSVFEQRWTYDEFGRQTSEYENDDGEVTETTFARDLFGNSIRTESFYAGKLGYHSTSTYSEGNQLLTSTEIWADGESRYESRKYDKYGNVTWEKSQDGTATYTYTPIYK